MLDCTSERKILVQGQHSRDAGIKPTIELVLQRIPRIQLAAVAFDPHLSHENEKTETLENIISPVETFA